MNVVKQRVANRECTQTKSPEADPPPPPRTCTNGLSRNRFSLSLSCKDAASASCCALKASRPKALDRWGLPRASKRPASRKSSSNSNVYGNSTLFNTCCTTRMANAVHLAATRCAWDLVATDLVCISRAAGTDAATTTRCSALRLGQSKKKGSFRSLKPVLPTETRERTAVRALVSHRSFRPADYVAGCTAQHRNRPRLVLLRE